MSLLYHENIELVVFLVVHFELRMYYGIICFPRQYTFISFNWHIWLEISMVLWDKELAVLLVVHFDLRRYYGLICCPRLNTNVGF